MYSFALITALFVFTVLGAVLFSKLELVVKYSRQGSDDNFSLEFYLWRGVLKWRLEVPLVEVEKKAKRREFYKPVFFLPFWRRIVPSPAFKLKAELEDKKGVPLKESEILAVLPGPARLARSVNRLLKFYALQRSAIHCLLRRVVVVEFCWETEVGGCDPALTGILAGVAWAVKWAVFLPLFRLAAAWEGPFKINVRSSFDGGALATSLYCHLELRLYSLLLATLVWLSNYLKHRFCSA